MVVMAAQQLACAGEQLHGACRRGGGAAGSRPCWTHVGAATSRRRRVQGGRSSVSFVLDRPLHAHEHGVEMLS